MHFIKKSFIVIRNFFFPKKKKICYDDFKNRGFGGMKKGYLSAIQLAEYIKERYRTTYDKEISSLKLQKSLYFCFAYWAGFVSKDDSNTEIKELGEELNPILFDDRIEAWAYGPVVPEVFRHQKECEDGRTNRKLCQEILKYTNITLEKNDTLKGAINDILDDIFNISDFGLVSMSHNDYSWYSNYNENDIKHNREIKKETIINEYSKKALN